ncbi:MAG: Gfo/Idh/MocA family oxidoreductase [Armatimonadetes bacterium]|nr:Gfo/Idh/MocA family oxidoreductase [Armatimonadota bacterium]MDW8122139.1 Gfo/Idh/MocA family oxidoreductase [Armatimonadota bacterium]
MVRRRDLLKIGAGALLFPLFRRSVLGANETVGVGVIGCGGMGQAHIGTLMELAAQGEKVRVVGVCDVYRKRVEGAASWSKAKAYFDYRQVLDDPEVDAVCIVTPDHWHTKMALDALEAGKDVYCEKPMTHWKQLTDPLKIAAAVNRHRRVFQVGTQGMSDSIWEQVAELIKAGELGTIVQAQAADMRDGHWGVLCGCWQDCDPDARPDVNLDWDMWLGHRFGLAPWRPWHSARFFAYRIFWDYSGGIGADWFPHILTPLVRSLGLGFPHKVTASGGLYLPEHQLRWEVPDIFQMIVEYPNGPSLHLMACLGNATGAPMMIRGSRATLVFEGEGATLYPGQRKIVRTRHASLQEHWRDFLRCVRTREKPRSNETLGVYVMTAINLGIHSYLKGRTLTWDGKSMKPVLKQEEG